MIIKSSWGWPLLSFVLVAGLTHAAPVPVLNVSTLVERADLVVMGRITYVSDAGPAGIDTANGRLQARSMIGELQVDHVFKGTVATRVVRFQFTLPDIPMGYRGVAEGTYRVLFLTGSDAPYRFTSPYHPSVIALSGAAISAKQPADGVFEAVGAMLRSPASTATDKREAINALWGVGNAPALAALRYALGERDRTLQLNAAAALLAANDVTALPVAAEALLRTSEVLPDDILLNLRGAISRSVTSDKAVPILGRLLRAVDPATRRAAVSALGRTNSQAAISHLGRALDDADFEVRLACVRGLAEITGQNERRPSADAFRTDEERLLRYWKDWVAGRR